MAAVSETKFDRREMEETLAGLGKRVFLMYNVHEAAPLTFQTRWTMSFLAGPLTRTQIKTLMDPLRPASETSDPEMASSAQTDQASRLQRQQYPLRRPPRRAGSQP